MNENLSATRDSEKSRRVVVVLGMHRSGTSALTKALNVLGVSLSENLMPEGEFNPKGHWEDLDIVAINEKLLGHLGLMWFTPQQPEINFNDPMIASLLDDAVTLVTQRVQMYPLWGFKDPRTPFLLSFWQEVFRTGNIHADYIFIHRNPLDISRSLHQRNCFSHRHSYLLWLMHTAVQLPRLKGESIHWMTFEQLITSPSLVLDDLKSFLDISDVSQTVLNDYCKQFIDRSLNHSMTSATDLQGDSDAFQPVPEYHLLLERLAHEAFSLEQWFETEYSAELQESLKSSLEVQKEHWLMVRDTVMALFESRVLNTEIKDQLKHSGLRCEQLQIDSRNRQAELNISIEKLRTEIRDTHGRLSDSLQELAEYQKALHDEKAAKAEYIEETQKERLRLHDEIEQHRHALNAVYHSTSWRITKPVRQAKVLLERASGIPALVQKHGGIVSLTKKVIRVLRQQGLSGLRYKAQQEALIDYGQWLERYGTVSDLQRSEMKKRVESLNNLPLISILMPVYNPPVAYLTEAIESVRAQIYPNWQLCIADDASTDPKVWQVLSEYAEKDARIQVIKREDNGHISRTTNSALEIAEGEFIALMDHDDKLAPDALFWVSEKIFEQKDVAMIYSDEDKITADGVTRYDPNFKSGWNPALLLSQNYVSHLGVYRTELAREIGGFRTGFEGAQDWDFTLRFVENIRQHQIAHIPRILYHWRAIEGSTAVDEEEKPYALEAGLKAVEEHLQRQQKIAVVSRHPERHYARVQYQIPADAPKVSIIIPTRNGLDVLSVCLESVLEKTTYPNYEIIIVDNGSDCKDTLDYLRNLSEKDERVSVIRDDSPFNYSALNNKAAAAASGDIITLLNNDIEVITPDWLTEMVGYAIQPENGAVGARLWYPDDTLQHGGVILVGGVAGHAHKHLPKGMPGYSCRAIVPQNFSAVTAACLVIRKEIFDELGGLNAENLSVAFNDIDFCLRVQEAGYFNVWTPYAELYHYESKTRGFEDTPEKIARFQKEVEYMQNRWGTLLLQDPCYNPNLTLAREDFSLAEVPRV
ncbi:Hyaluronan synthase [Vibrio aerogenes CECT 7868]|uniref:Hyaluronan synthase n=1 Tax=Vibrio aerogenes CECT 7868 TaxID=1216006 RepID=A0A1M5ZCB3_9VIBR|nr:glycosyltransferase [Vibrio aerogenes]SHI21860.1 Hyaluronan synthase [Vibrio aerogenes CECT 7868]